MINGTVKYTHLENSKAAGKSKSDDSLEWLTATTSIYVQINVKARCHFTDDINTPEKIMLVLSEGQKITEFLIEMESKHLKHFTTVCFFILQLCVGFFFFFFYTLML